MKKQILCISIILLFLLSISLSIVLSPAKAAAPKIQFQYILFPTSVFTDSVINAGICFINQGEGGYLVYDGTTNFDEVSISIPVGIGANKLISDSSVLSYNTSADWSCTIDTSGVTGGEGEFLLIFRPNGTQSIAVGETTCFDISGLIINLEMGLARLLVDQQFDPSRSEKEKNVSMGIFKTDNVSGIIEIDPTVAENVKDGVGFNELTGTATDTQIPDDITINNALDSDKLGGQEPVYYAVATHTHNFSELEGSISDDQIPDTITVNEAKGMRVSPSAPIPVSEGEVYFDIGDSMAYVYDGEQWNEYTGPQGPAGPIAGNNKQLIYNNSGSAEGAEIYYNNSTQSIGIGIDNPNPKAALEINSNSKGFLPPRMSTSQIQAINSPPEGLMVYNTTVKKVQFYNGTIWKNSDGSPNIGDEYQGGIVFYIDETGKHGLIVATIGQSTGATWGCEGTSIPTSAAVGFGQANTTAIVTHCGEAEIAARICDNLVLNGYSDWYLPSKDELNLLFQQRNMVGLGGFNMNYYWSSTESSIWSAWRQYFWTGFQSSSSKGPTQGIYSVRAIRSF